MSEAKPGNWFLSYTGKQVNPWTMTMDDVCVEDIAHALSNVCRFGGHTKEFYSVAQHSVLVASILPDELQLVGLLHDATEAYVGDMVRPIKVMMPDYVNLEAHVWGVISAKWNLPFNMPTRVKSADNQLLMTERRDLMHPGGPDWSKWTTEKPCSFLIRPWKPVAAENRFFYEFERLTKGL